LRTAVEDDGGNRAVIERWVTHWGDIARRAEAGFDFLFQRTPGPATSRSTLTATMLAEIGVEVPAA
jgi:hypothetical protein